MSAATKAAAVSNRSAGNANSNGQTYSNSKRGSYTEASPNAAASAVTLADSP